MKSIAPIDPVRPFALAPFATSNAESAQVQ